MCENIKTEGRQLRHDLISTPLPPSPQKLKSVSKYSRVQKNARTLVMSDQFNFITSASTMIIKRTHMHRGGGGGVGLHAIFPLANPSKEPKSEISDERVPLISSRNLGSPCPSSGLRVKEGKELGQLEKGFELTSSSRPKTKGWLMPSKQQSEGRLIFLCDEQQSERGLYRKST